MELWSSCLSSAFPERKSGAESRAETQHSRIGRTLWSQVGKPRRMEVKGLARGHQSVRKDLAGTKPHAVLWFSQTQFAPFGLRPLTASASPLIRIDWTPSNMLRAFDQSQRALQYGDSNNHFSIGPNLCFYSHMLSLNLKQDVVKTCAMFLGHVTAQLWWQFLVLSSELGISWGLVLGWAWWAP